MTRLVFVHGMSQQGNDRARLQQQWRDALESAWRQQALDVPAHQLEMPFYGDVLNDLTLRVRSTGTDAVVGRGEAGAPAFSALEEDWLRAIAGREGITDAEVSAELGQEIVARGAANWEWVQALARLVERRSASVGRLGLSFVHQVDAYLTRPQITKAVDAIVAPALSAADQVVVAHSLGTIVSYRLLRKAQANVAVRLLVTLGSPLGIEAVKRHLRPPALAVPPGVAGWLNGADERDYVALYARLERSNFAEGIENLPDVKNGEDAHSITAYLSDRSVCRRIHAALSAG